MLVLGYTSYKIYILEGKKSIDVVQAVKENHFDDSSTFGAEQGLNIAVTVFNPFDSSWEQQVAPVYGRIRFLRL